CWTAPSPCRWSRRRRSIPASARSTCRRSTPPVRRRSATGSPPPAPWTRFAPGRLRWSPPRSGLWSGPSSSPNSASFSPWSPTESSSAIRKQAAPTGAAWRSPDLLGGADEDLVDGDVPRARHHVGDRVGDVLGLEDVHVLEPFLDLLFDGGAVVPLQLGRHRSRLDQRDPYVAPRHLLAQRLAEGADPVLGRVVDGAASARLAAGDGGDVDQVGDPPRV